MKLKKSGKELSVEKIADNFANSEVVKNIQDIMVKETVKDRKTLELILIWAAAVGATILTLVVAILPNIRPGSGIDTKLTLVSSKAVTVVGDTLINQKGQTKNIGETPVYVYQNLDKSVAAYLIREDDEIELWYSDSKLKPVKIDSAETISECFVSDDGKHIAYVTQDSATSSIQDSDGTVYIYSVRNKDKEKIASDVVPYTVVASPDCRTVSYMSNYEQFDDNDMYVNGIDIEKKKVAKNGCFAAAVSNKAKSVIYVDGVEEKLYYFDGEESEKITSNVDVRKVFVNRNAEEILFSRKGKTYLYKAGKEEADKLCSSGISEALCTCAEWGTPSVRLCVDSMSELIFSESEKSELLLISTLEDDASSIAEDCRAYKYSDDGKSLLYADEDGLHLVKISDDPKDKLIYEAEEIAGVFANGDFSRIYVINEDDELIYVTVGGKDSKVSSDLSSKEVAVSALTGKVYYIEDDDLYEADKTKSSKKKIKSDIVSLTEEIAGIAYVSDSDKVGLIFK